HQHRVDAERGIDLHGELRRNAPALRAEAVQPLDAMLGVESVAAHVPLADGTGRGGDGIRRAHKADDGIALREAIPRFDHASERLVPEDQSFVTARRFAVVAIDNFAIRAANAERDRLDQKRALRGGRLRHIAQLNGIRFWRTYGDGAQMEIP